MAVLENAKHKAERAAVSALADRLLKKLNHAENYEERTEIYLQIVDLAEKFFPEGKDKIEKVRSYVSDPNHRWMKMINHIIDDADPHYAKMMLLNLGYESFLEEQKPFVRIVKNTIVIFHG